MTIQASSSPARPGWLTFAAAVLFTVGALQAFAGIYYLAAGSRASSPGGTLGHHLVLLGICELVVAAVSFYGGRSLLAGHTFGRIVGYVWAGLVLLEGVLVASSAPWLAFTALLLAGLVVYALAETRNWRER
jgi:hypothetical protein